MRGASGNVRPADRVSADMVGDRGLVMASVLRVTEPVKLAFMLDGPACWWGCAIGGALTMLNFVGDSALR